MNRLGDKWKTSVRYTPAVLGDDTEFLNLFRARANRREENQTEESFTYGIWKQCHEVILSTEEDGAYCLDLITRALDADTLEIVVGPTLRMSELGSIQDLARYFALAMLENVPIYGNTPELHEYVISLQKQVIRDGFVVEDPQGKSFRVKLTQYNELDLEDHKALAAQLARSGHITPGEIHLLTGAVSGRIRELTETTAYIDKVQEALNELEGLLHSEKRNEHQLQRCLTANPILFGTDYARVIPKHRLGGEYEMDYALERFDGTYDLMEIEASTLPLYGKKGDPRAQLVHAEQQVLDWQAWIEEKNFYAREGLPNVSMPRGFVVIGRKTEMSVSDKRRLAIRNQVLRPRLEILTYDDLLEKCRTLLQRLNSGSDRVSCPDTDVPNDG